MEVICLEDAAFYTLLEKVVEQIKDTHSVWGDKWINTEQAKHKLGITCKTTLQRYRDERIFRETRSRHILMEQPYKKGFNSGYQPAKHEPELFNHMLKSLSGDSEYIHGLKMGKQQVDRENCWNKSNNQNDQTILTATYKADRLK